VQRFLGGLVFKAHRLLYHSTLGLRVIKKKRLGVGAATLACRFEGVGFRVQGLGFRVQGSGFRVQGSGFRVQGSGFGG